MNINMLRDLDDDPGFYLAASGKDTKWQGCVVYQSSDNGATYQAIASVGKAATIGTVTGAPLGDFKGGNVPDELNVLRVKLRVGELSSVSHAALLEGAQQAVIGDEIVYFRDAVLNADGSYTLTGFLRGRRGTEHKIGAHGAGERFVLLSPTTLQRIAQTTADIGKTRLYKAVSVGMTLAATPAQSFTNEGSGLKPYAPVEIGGGRDADGNVLIHWTRRTRISGEWRDGVDVPLGESSEAYELEITDAGYASVKRTISGLSVPAATYSAADQAADGFAPGDPIHMQVYQLSSTVGRGYPGKALLWGVEEAGGSGGDAGGGGDTGGAPPSGPTSTVSYATSTANMSNPERGFYVHILHDGSFSSGNLNTYKAQGMSLVLYQAYLTAYKSAPLDSAFLTAFQNNLNSIRSNGMKTILRFAYTQDANDAPLSRIEGHLDQLAPYFASNSDVILGLQCGFVGPWGEFQTSSNFGIDPWPPNLSSTDKAARKAVIDKALSVMPTNRFVQVRQPWIKREFYSTSPVSEVNKFGISNVARLGHFNDCFLATANDSGTYYQQATEEAYLEVDTKYVPMGGETCSLNEPRSAGASAVTELARFHWTFLNSGFNADVINSWKASGHYADIAKKLGYRLALTSGSYSAGAAPGGSIAVSMQLTNSGYAAPFAARTVMLVLRNTVTSAETVLPMAVDWRNWLPGAITVSETVALPSGIAAGSYALLLWLPDAAAGLASTPAYSVQLANAGVWESATGYNDLGHTITIS